LHADFPLALLYKLPQGGKSMRGTILGVDGQRGVLLDISDRRFEFALSEWRTPGLPRPGQVVDFVEQDGEARAVFLVPGQAAPAAQSNSVMLGAFSVGCLALGFIIPLVPTLAALILGVLGAKRAHIDNDETGLILSRIGWIGALVLLIVGIVALAAVATMLGGLAGLWALHVDWNDFH
jgi:hypothetical protein